VGELQSEVDFPYDMEEFRETLKRVEDRDRDRGRLAAETADSSNAIKAFVIKAEDARILNDTTNMRRMYGELFDLNRELIVEHGKRAENHEELLAALREVNQMIQRAAKMRAGRAKTKVVAACRKAIKQNNTQALFQIIAHGAEEAE
jgi:Bardet-Biedl syndrome 2 protein